MAVVVAAKESLAKRTVSFYHDVVAEMKKVTWPDRPQVTQLSIGVIGLSLFIGVVIWLLDIVLQGLLVNLIPSIFR
jgi:preprotein translocase, SecE subunit, bacterial